MEELLGTTIIPCWIRNLSRIWAGVFPNFSAMSSTVGSWRQLGTSLPLRKCKIRVDKLIPRMILMRKWLTQSHIYFWSELWQQGTPRARRQSRIYCSSCRSAAIQAAAGKHAARLANLQVEFLHWKRFFLFDWDWNLTVLCFSSDPAWPLPPFPANLRYFCKRIYQRTNEAVNSPFNSLSRYLSDPSPCREEALSNLLEAPRIQRGDEPGTSQCTLYLIALGIRSNICLRHAVCFRS